jgi:hypothetical protein
MRPVRLYLHRLDSLLAAGVLALVPAAGFTFAFNELFGLSPFAGILLTLPPCMWLLYLIVHRDPILPPRPALLRAMEDYARHLRSLSAQEAADALELLPSRKPSHDPRHALPTHLTEFATPDHWALFHRRTFLCPSCGYNLLSDPAACPECGLPNPNLSRDISANSNLVSPDR